MVRVKAHNPVLLAASAVAEAPALAAKLGVAGGLWLLCLSLALLLVAPPLSARNGPGSGPPTFAEFDLDGDGQLTEAEFYQARAQRIAERAAEGRQMKHLADAPSFTDLDIDANGVVDPAEFSSHQAQHRARKNVQKPPENPDNV
jgi:hypothetical protein